MVRCQVATGEEAAAYITYAGVNRTELNAYYFGDEVAAALESGSSDGDIEALMLASDDGYYRNVHASRNVSTWFPGAPLVGDSTSSACLGPCVDFDVVLFGHESTLNHACPTAACSPYNALAPVRCNQYQQSACLANCYCLARLNNHSSVVGYARALLDIAAGYNDELCTEVVLLVAGNVAITYGAIAVLASINVAMMVILKRLTQFERHPATGNENRANLLKVHTSYRSSPSLHDISD